MLFRSCFGKVPNKDIVKAFDVSLILYAEHSFNVSTFTARTITSSLSDIHGAITGAIASLKGPLHGGANEEVMHMMSKIKKPENALKWIKNALKNKDVVMGFGHRVYKSGDSRVPTMREYFGKVAKIKKDKKFEKIYDIVEKVMIKEKNIHPNVPKGLERLRITVTPKHRKEHIEKMIKALDMVWSKNNLPRKNINKVTVNI